MEPLVALAASVDVQQEAENAATVALNRFSRSGFGAAGSSTVTCAGASTKTEALAIAPAPSLPTE